MTSSYHPSLFEASWPKTCLFHDQTKKGGKMILEKSSLSTRKPYYTGPKPFKALTRQLAQFGLNPKEWTIILEKRLSTNSLLFRIYKDSDKEMTFWGHAYCPSSRSSPMKWMEILSTENLVA